MSASGPSLSPYNTNGGVKTGRTGMAGDYVNGTLRAKSAGPSANLCAGTMTFSGVKTFTVIPVITWVDYPTGIIDIPISAGIPTSGAPAAIYNSATSGGTGWRNNWPYPSAEPELHAIELRYYCQLYSSSTRQIVWLSSGGGSSYEAYPPGPSYPGHHWIPSISTDITADFEMSVDVNLEERVSIVQNTGAGGAWVWPEDCFHDGMGKTTATFTASATNIQTSITINGSTFASSAMPSGYITSYPFDSSRTIEGTVGLLTTLPAKFGWGAMETGFFTMAGSAVFGSLTDIAHMNMGVKEMDLRLNPAVSGYQGDDTNCRGLGVDNTFTYMAKNAPAAADGKSIYVDAKWTDLGLSYKHQVDFQVMDASTQSETPSALPQFVDSATSSSWYGSTSPLFTFDGTWTLKMYNLSGNLMATRNPSTDSVNASASWARSNPAPSTISIRFNNPQDFNVMARDVVDSLTELTETRDDFRCQFVYPRDSEVGSYTLPASSLLDSMSATGTAGVSGWTAVGCSMVVSGGNLLITNASSSAYIYRSDFKFNGDIRQPKHWMPYRFAQIRANCTTGSASGAPIAYNLALTVSRTGGPDTMSKTFAASAVRPTSGEVRDGLSASGWMARYDTCHPNNAGYSDTTNSYIEQALPLNTEWIDGERVGAEYSNLSWSWGIGCFDTINVSGFTSGCTYLLIDLAGTYINPAVTGVERTYHGLTTYVQGECDMERAVGDMVINDEPLDNWRMSVWRHIIGVVNGKYGFEVPCVKVAKSPNFAVDNYVNYSVFNAFSSGSSGAFYPNDDFRCYNFSLNSNYSSGSWDNATSGYTTEAVLFNADTCPIWFCQTHHSSGEQDNIYTTSLRAAPLYDVVTIYPNWGDGTGTTTRTGYATLKSIKRVQGRANGNLFIGNALPEIVSTAPSAQYVEVSATSTYSETIKSDKLGYYRTGEHKTPTSFTYTSTSTASDMKSRVWQRICMIDTYASHLRYRPSDGKLLFKQGVLAPGSLSACLAPSE